MNQNNRQYGQGVRGNYGDGFGGVTAAYFSSPLETMPAVPTELPAVPSPIPTRDYGNKGMDGEVVHGLGDNDGDESAVTSDGFPCTHEGCGFVARSRHGSARHIKAAHGGFGGLGRGIHR